MMHGGAQIKSKSYVFQFPMSEEFQVHGMHALNNVAPGLPLIFLIKIQGYFQVFDRFYKIFQFFSPYFQGPS